MKKLCAIAALCLAAVLSLMLVGCGSSYGALKKAFEEAGYTESENLERVAETIKEEAEKDSLSVTMHGMSKVDGLQSNFVMIIEFNSTEDMKKLYDESNTIQGFVKDIEENENAEEFKDALEEAGYAKGNCLVSSSNALAMNEVTNIVKNA